MRKWFTVAFLQSKIETKKSISECEREFAGIPPGPDLALAQRDGTHFLRELHDISKLVEVSSWVTARGQDEDEGSEGRRLLEDHRQVWGLGERGRKGKIINTAVTYCRLSTEISPPEVLWSVVPGELRQSPAGLEWDSQPSDSAGPKASGMSPALCPILLGGVPYSQTYTPC